MFAFFANIILKKNIIVGKVVAEKEVFIKHFFILDLYILKDLEIIIMMIL